MRRRAVRLLTVTTAVAALMSALVLVDIPAAAAGQASGRSGGLVVRTDKGFVRGSVRGGDREFLGIPYAAPPVGDLRWRPAEDHARWKGVLDATRFGSPCPQVGGAFGPASTNEDCLFLNVSTPAGSDPVDRLPVMFWIHGGALVSGAGSLYDPSQLVARGVVVVTINYRLGELGFLAHSALAPSPGGPAGNYGLTDQQEALRWTQRNIRRFGGDPANVTIFGESAGGLSVHSQLVSPLARGLFAKAIVESGAYAMTQASLAEAEKAGFAFASQVGCAGQSASCLRGVPVATLLTNQGSIVNPNLDGRVLTQSIGPALAAGNFNRVPVIEGTNHDEWALFVALTELITGHPLAAADYVAAIQQTLGVSALVAQFLAGFYPLTNYGGNPSLALTALGTDAIFACNARAALRSMSGFVPTFQYEFSDENAPPFFKVSFPMGAYHAAELQYLFANLDGTLTADQRKLSADMVGYWTQFARTGSPNSPARPAWPAYMLATEMFQSLVPPSPAPSSGFAAKHQCSVWGG
jgi:para-nitrobenzyl esterase